MTKRLVCLLIGVVVDAEDDETARRKAATPFQYGLLPGCVAVANVGTRIATPDDEAGEIQRRLNAMAYDVSAAQEI